MSSFPDTTHNGVGPLVGPRARSSPHRPRDVDGVCWVPSEGTMTANMGSRQRGPSWAWDGNSQGFARGARLGKRLGWRGRGCCEWADVFIPTLQGSEEERASYP